MELLLPEYQHGETWGANCRSLEESCTYLACSHDGQVVEVVKQYKYLDTLIDDKAYVWAVCRNAHQWLWRWKYPPLCVRSLWTRGVIFDIISNWFYEHDNEFTELSSVTTSQSNIASLRCDGMGDLHLECAAYKCAAPVQRYHVDRRTSCIMNVQHLYNAIMWISPRDVSSTLLNLNY